MKEEIKLLKKALGKYAEDISDITFKVLLEFNAEHTEFEFFSLLDLAKLIERALKEQVKEYEEKIKYLEEVIIHFEKHLINPKRNKLPKKIKGKGYVPMFKFIKQKHLNQGDKNERNIKRENKTT